MPRVAPTVQPGQDIDHTAALETKLGHKMPSTTAVVEMTGGLANGARLLGKVKSFSKNNGYGFINVSSNHTDIYFKTSSLTSDLRQWLLQRPSLDAVAVEIVVEALPDDKWHAVHVGLSPHGEQCRNRADEEALLQVPPPVRVLPPAAGRSTGGARAMPAGQAASVTEAASNKRACKRGWGVSRKVDFDTNIAELRAMGFTEEAAHDALAEGLDMNAALDLLFSGPSAGLDVSDNGDSTNEQAYGGGAGRSVVATEPAVDWQVVLGTRETALPVAAGVGLSSVAELCPVSHAVGEAAEAVLPFIREMLSLQTQPLSPRHLARVRYACLGGISTNQLAVPSGTLVHVWPETQTEIGWVYAERLCEGCTGWVPLDALKPLAAGFRWMCVARSWEAMGDAQISVQQGKLVLADVDNSTEAGWALTKLPDGARGWLPVCVLAEVPASLRWMYVSSACEATYKTQVSVQVGSALLVDCASRTREGWVYAHGSDAGDQGIGWVAAACLEWPEE